MATTVKTERHVDLERPLPSEEYVPRALPTVIGRFDMLALYVCSLFLFTNAVLSAAGGTVSLLYMAIGVLFFFIPCVMATAQLGVMFPHTGSLYNWTYKALGSRWNFFVTLCFWVTGVLAAVTGADAFVTVVQGLNNNWLTDPWQQGAVILTIIAISTAITLQRMRTALNVVNAVFLITMVAVALAALAALGFLATGHASATSFVQPADWSINSSNFFLFGIITLNFIGASGAMNMAGEIQDRGQKRQIILSPLLWGTVIVTACYFIVDISALIVRGPAMLNAAVLPFEGFTAIYQVLGKFAGSVAALCFLMYAVISNVFYTLSSSRLLLAASIDGRVPVWFGRLNKNRSPQNAILFQSFSAAVIVLAIFVLAPLIANFGGSAATTLIDIYTVFSAAVTLVWTVATSFFFVDLFFLYRRNPLSFRQQSLFPMPVLWTAIIVGFVACIATVIGILRYSWIEQLIVDGQWWYLVGGLTIIVLIIAWLLSLFGSSQAAWETIIESDSTSEARQEPVERYR